MNGHTSLVDTALGRVAVRTAGDGPPLVLLTGFAAYKEDWHPELVAALAARYRVLAVDNPGLGGTDPLPGTPSVRAMGEQVAALLECSAGEPAAVLGWSMGGIVAQSLAVRRPDLVRALVLAAAAPGVAGTLGPDPAAAAVLADPTATGLAGVLFPGRPDAARAYATAVAAEHGARQPVPRAVLAGQVRAIDAWRRGTDPDGARVGELTVPVLLAAAGRDSVDPPANERSLAGLLPRAESASWPDDGHGFLFADPTGFATTVLGFLATHWRN